MEKEKKDRTIVADEDTHTELSVIAARKKITIKAALKKVVDFYLDNEDGENHE